jgi:hypothetical protein
VVARRLLLRTGTVSLTDVLYDFVTRHQYIGVGVSVTNVNHILIGILHAFVDISSLLPLVNRADLAGGRMALVKSDGSIIAGSGGVSVSGGGQYRTNTETNHPIPEGIGPHASGR